MMAKAMIPASLMWKGYETCTTCHDSHTLEVNFDDCTQCHEGLNSTEDLVSNSHGWFLSRF